MKRALIILAKLALAVALFAYLILNGQLDFSRLLEVQSWVWVVVAQLFVVLVLVFTSYRWYLLLRAQGIDRNFREVFVLGTIGFFFNQFVPGSTGGDVVKAYYIAVDHPELRAAGVTTVFLDRVLGLLILMLISGAAILFNTALVFDDAHLRVLAVLVAGVIVGTLVFSLLFFSDHVRSLPWVRRLFLRLPFARVLSKVQRAVYIYKGHPGVIVQAMLLSAGVQLSIVAINISFFFAIGGDGADVAVSSFFFLVPLAQLAMSVPISPPGGLGVGEWAMSELFKKAGYADGAVLMLFQRASYYLWALLGLVFYLKRKKKVEAAIAMGEAAEEMDAQLESRVEEAPASAHGATGASTPQRARREAPGSAAAGER